MVEFLCSAVGFISVYVCVCFSIFILFCFVFLFVALFVYISDISAKMISTYNQ